MEPGTDWAGNGLDCLSAELLPPDSPSGSQLGLSASENAPAAEEPLSGLRLEQVSYGHPEATRLTDLAQAYYLSIYGGTDANPLTAAEFAAPLGAFLVGYLRSEAVAMGGWHFYSGPIRVAAERPAEIRRMFVVEPYRGRGLGWGCCERSKPARGQPGPT